MKDLVFLHPEHEPKGRVFVNHSPVDAHIHRQSSPVTYYKQDNGDWVYEGHCGHFSDGSVRPPWCDAEWNKRHSTGDPGFNDSSTYDLTEPKGTT